MVNDIKVIQGRDGLFISMPSRRKKNGEFKDVAHPLNNETRRWLESAILETYESELEARGESINEARKRGELRARPLSQPADVDSERSEPVSERRSLFSAV